MDQSIINITMDKNLKKEFDNICQELGLTMATAITMLAKTMIREKRLPFEVTLDPFYSKSNLQALDKSIQQMKEGKTITKTLEELENFANE
ncbi:type II toxin-antitoxin system RelB/DinJ family antitoxin [bacterium]|nr:type II toxin-antitoxin system RelB/DinJ family antitoxin [bacterium]